MTGNSDTFYSLSWASFIVEQLCEGHARVSHILLGILHLSHQQLAYLLACKRKEYYIIREAIRKADRNIERNTKLSPEAWFELSTTWVLSTMVNESAQNGLDSFASYLTGRLRDNTIKEPVKRESSDSTTVDEEGNLLFFPLH